MSEFIQPALIRRLAEAVYGRWPASRGWKMICGSSQQLGAALVHARPCLSDSGMVPGYRVENLDAQPLTLAYSELYPNLFVRRHDYDFPPEVDALVAAAERDALPWLMLEAHGERELIWVYEKDGTRTLLPSSAHAPKPCPARLEIKGRESLPVEELFPFHVSANSDVPIAAFSVTAQHLGSDDRTCHYLIGDETGPPLGSGVLEFDVRCRVGQPDELVIKVSGFSGDAVLTELAVPPRGQPQPSFRVERPVCLHVVFDRTTLDENAWPLALNTLMGFSREAGDDDEAYATRQGEAVSWNREVRDALADALGEAAEALHRGETLFHLWWFADTPRPGIAPLSAVPSARNPYGDVTTCPRQRLPLFLGSSAFDYAPGFDLFDAVDEVMERVAEVVQEGVNRREQHAVLIVGDSPPPPSSKEDLLWERLVKRPPRTNARCSPHFKNALQTLRRLRVPAGWLYLSLSETSPSEGARRNFDELHQDVLSLKQEIFRTLQQVSPDDLVVEDCSGVGEMVKVLRQIFERMAYRKPEITPLDCGELLPETRRVKTWT